jgi:hypothetical protein
MLILMMGEFKKHAIDMAPDPVIYTSNVMTIHSDIQVISRSLP